MTQPHEPSALDPNQRPNIEWARVSVEDLAPPIVEQLDRLKRGGFFCTWITRTTTQKEAIKNGEQTRNETPAETRRLSTQDQQ